MSLSCGILRKTEAAKAVGTVLVRSCQTSPKDLALNILLYEKKQNKQLSPLDKPPQSLCCQIQPNTPKIQP